MSSKNTGAPRRGQILIESSSTPGQASMNYSPYDDSPAQEGERGRAASAQGRHPAEGSYESETEEENEDTHRAKRPKVETLYGDDEDEAQEGGGGDGDDNEKGNEPYYDENNGDNGK
jgi:hypothetical protein